jgi:uncharacterized protein (DUF3084 family)
MKKNYAIFIVPLAGILVFAGLYWNHASEYEARLEAADQKRQEERQEKLRLETIAKKHAIEEAIAAQDRRKKEKAERDTREAKEKEDRELALQLRTKTREDARKLQDQVRRLQKEIDENKKEIAKVQEERKRVVDEQNFLKDYVKQAEANTQRLSNVLERIAAADKAAEDAARAAAAAAKAATSKK